MLLPMQHSVPAQGYGLVQPAVKLGRPPPPPVKVSTRPSTVSTVAKWVTTASAQAALLMQSAMHALPMGCLPLHSLYCAGTCYMRVNIQ
jgi:hypothetical protein